MAEAEEWFCYMVRCNDDSLYVGIAANVEEKVKRHNCGIGAEFTVKRRPVNLIWSERCGSGDAARQREKEVKGWNRKKKIELAKQWKGVNPTHASRARGKEESRNS